MNAASSSALPAANALQAPASKGVGVAEIPTNHATDSPPPNEQEVLLRGKDTSDAMGDEFQRFVAKATGTSLPLFGSHLFMRAPSTFAPVNNVPVTPDYVLGPGDELMIRIWGSVDGETRTLIDRNGQINLPKVGTIGLAGIRAGEAEGYLRTKLNRVYKNFELNVTLGQLRAIQVYVVGHAKRPGVYSLSGLSTLINALFASGGPAPAGSMRHVQLKRGGQVITELDLYQFIINGDNSHDARLQAGDVIVIPPAGARVAITGAFNTPAIYELKTPQSSIREMLETGGGVPVVAEKRLAALERINHRKETPRNVEELALDDSGMARQLQNGDILTLFPISPKFDNAITLKGNVASPMRYAWRSGMRVSDLLVDGNTLIPLSYWQAQNQGKVSHLYNKKEVNWDYATIQRLNTDKLTTRLFAFNLGKAIRGDTTENMPLEPGDIVTVYSWNDELPLTENSVQLSAKFIGGSKRFVWREGMTLRDIIPNKNWLIEYYDYWLNTRTTEKRVEINWDYANIVRLSPKDLSKNYLPFNLTATLDNKESITLLPGDEISLYTSEEVKIPLAKRKMFVSVFGEVVTPGIYQVHPGETLRQLVSRIGGLTPQSYLYAAEFYRESTRIQQQQKLDIALDKMEKSLTLSASEATQSALSAEDIAATQAQQQFQRQVLQRMREIKASGRVVLEVPPKSNTLAAIPDLPLEDGDRLVVPSMHTAVNVVGEVNNENSFLFKPGKSLADYLAQAGGPTKDGDENLLYVLKADGSTSTPNRGWFSAWLQDSQIMPGDTIVVPILSEKRSWTKDIKEWTQILYQFGMGMASLKVLKDL